MILKTVHNLQQIQNSIDTNALNFSNWEKYTQTQKNEKLKAIYRTAHSSMPLPAYTWAHIEAELSKEDREKIRDWTGVRK
jgi:hypothetical protein